MFDILTSYDFGVDESGTTDRLAKYANVFSDDVKLMKAIKGTECCKEYQKDLDKI